MASLITGVGGFAGQHLAAHLLSRGETVVGGARREVRWHVPTVPTAPRFATISADLTSAVEARRAVGAANPDRIYHLAAQSSVADSLADPLGTIQNNCAALVHLLEATREITPTARVLVVSSAEVYGRSASGPIDETAELRPESPYAVSKAAVDLLAYQYYVSYGLPIVRVRPFNHIGPGQSDRFVASSFARQIVEIERGIREPVLEVGNLDAQRDFTDVRDMVRAYELALTLGEPGSVYNLGCGTPTIVRAILDHLLALSRKPAAIRVDPQRLRRTDAPLQVCDARRFHARTQWEPVIPLDVTLSDLLDYWRTQVASP